MRKCEREKPMAESDAFCGVKENYPFKFWSCLERYIIEILVPVSGPIHPTAVESISA